MIYLQTFTILVTIQKLVGTDQNQVYLVGDTVYDNLSTQITKDAFHEANWNRALKYGLTCLDDQKETLVKNHRLDLTQPVQTGYYKLVFDLYYDEAPNLLKPLTKNNFDQQIVNQKAFPPFLNTIIKKANNGRENYDLEIPHDLWTTELVNFHHKRQLPTTNFTQFIVDETFDLTKVKYKYLIVAGTTTSCEITKHHQLVYTYDATKIPLLKNEFSYLDYHNHLIYLNGWLKTKNQDPLALTLYYENQPLVEALMTQILIQFQTYFANNELALIHYYNLTNDLVYLVAELNQHPSLSYTETINQLNQKFDSTKSNHYLVIYNEPLLRNLLFTRVNNLEELKEFQHQAMRFGILSKSELQAIEKKFQEYR